MTDHGSDHNFLQKQVILIYNRLKDNILSVFYVIRMQKLFTDRQTFLRQSRWGLPCSSIYFRKTQLTRMQLYRANFYSAHYLF